MLPLFVLVSNKLPLRYLNWPYSLIQFCRYPALICLFTLYVDASNISISAVLT